MKFSLNLFNRNHALIKPGRRVIPDDGKYQNWFVIALLAVLMAGCGGGGNSSTPPPASLVAITVTPDSQVIAVGTTQQFSAIGAYSDSTRRVITTSVTWNSSDVGVATIDSRGLVTAAAPGSSTITATLESISGSTVLTSDTVSSIAISPNISTIAIGGTTRQFAATGTLSGGATQDLTKYAVWSSSDTGVANVNSSGLATSGNTVGTTNITADFDGQSGLATLTTDTVASIEVTPKDPGIAKGTKQQFKAIGTLSGSTTQDLTKFATWDSSDPAITTINGSGLATSLLVGTSGITAMFGGIVSNQAILTVTAPLLVSIAVTPTDPKIAFGMTLQFSAAGTYSDNSTGDITASVNWSSSNTAIADINSAGLATAGVTPGSTTIKAVSGSITGSTSLTVFSGQTVYVANSGSNTVSVIDTATGKEIARITAGNAPTGIAIDPLAHRAYATNNDDDTVSVIDTQSNTVVGAPIPVGKSPEGIAVDSSAKKAYVANHLDNTVSVIDTNSDAVIKTINLVNGSRPREIALDPSANRAYVTNNGIGTVSVIDTAGDTIAGTSIPVGGAPVGVAVNSIINRAYVANSGSGTVTVINTITPMVVTNITLSSGTHPWGVAVTPSGSTVYVTNNGSGTVSVIATANNTVIGTITAGSGPKGVAIDSSANRAYVANSGSNNVSVIDTDSNTVVGNPIQVGKSPSGIAVVQ